jgi:hypothetical protein
VDSDFSGVWHCVDFNTGMRPSEGEEKGIGDFKIANSLYLSYSPQNRFGVVCLGSDHSVALESGVQDLIH